MELDSMSIERSKTKLHSMRAIGIATFIGSPLAAGYLISENFKALEKPNAAQTSMVLGIVSTLVIFSALFFLPESTVNAIPNFVLPAAYTAIILFLVNKHQGDELEAHASEEDGIHKIGRAIIVGFIALAIVLGLMFAMLMIESDELTPEYQSTLDTFVLNEEKSLTFYDNLETKSDELLLQQLTTDCIPLWRENVVLLKRLSNNPEIDTEYIAHNSKLLRYSELRLQGFELFKDAFENTEKDFSFQLESVHEEINLALEELNAP